MKRITPEEVVEAYKKTGLKPMQHIWYDARHGCACGITAICALTQDLSYVHPRRVAGELYGLDYVADFVNGFDGVKWYHGSERGYEDGKSAWDAVVAAGLAKEENDK